MVYNKKQALSPLNYGGDWELQSYDWWLLSSWNCLLLHVVCCWAGLRVLTPSLGGSLDSYSFLPSAGLFTSGQCLKMLKPVGRMLVSLGFLPSDVLERHLSILDVCYFWVHKLGACGVNGTSLAHRPQSSLGTSTIPSMATSKINATLILTEYPNQPDPQPTSSTSLCNGNRKEYNRL
jgi:hypothetical protein